MTAAAKSPLALVLALTAAICLCFPCPAPAGQWDALSARLTADGLDPAYVKSVLERPEVKYDPKAMGAKLMEYYMGTYGSRLVRLIQSRLAALEYYFGPADGRLTFLTKAGLKAFQSQHGQNPDGKPSVALLRAAEAEKQKAPASLGLRELTPPKVTVYEVVLTPERLGEAREFYAANRPILRRVEAKYGIPAETMVGLLTVETRVGKFLGDDLAVNVLASMAQSPNFASVASTFPEEEVTPSQAAWLDAKAAEKSAWAYRELKALFAYARANNLDLATMPGSIYGAIGLCQFMPSNIPHFGVDGDGDGRVDLFCSPDALESLALFLRSHGFTPGAGEAAQRKALFRYNHSQVYVNTIMAVADYLRGKPLP